MVPSYLSCMGDVELTDGGCAFERECTLKANGLNWELVDDVQASWRYSEVGGWLAAETFSAGAFKLAWITLSRDGYGGMACW